MDNSTPAITSALSTMGINKIGHDSDLEDVRQGNDNATQLPTNSSSLVHAHSGVCIDSASAQAVSDPILSPVQKLPPETLAKIFIECIPSLAVKNPYHFDNETDPKQVCARLGRVCRVWNAILNDEPGVWATLVLDNGLDALTIVSPWIEKSKSHPLDISFQVNPWHTRRENPRNGDTVAKMLHKELWRIRSLAIDYIHYADISSLFPPDVLTEAPMMQSLTFECYRSSPGGRLGWIHCPQLRTLTLRNGDKVVGSLISKPMQNLHVLTIVSYRGENMLYIKLLQAVPNLVSLTWTNSELPLHDETLRVALPSLKSLTLQSGHWDVVTCLYVPSLEHLELGDFQVFNDGQGNLNMVLDVLCGGGAAQLRHLTLGNRTLKGANFHAMWHHLKHLETLIISDALTRVSADELFIALSPPNHDFSSVCPQLKTLELSNLYIKKTDVLVDFVQRRVKSDLGDDLVPGLVTCLKLSDMSVDKEVSAQLAKTHSLSVHLPTC